MNFERFSGLIVFDLGQNMAGWCRIRFRGPPGYGVYIRHGETITLPDIGTEYIYTLWLSH